MKNYPRKEIWRNFFSVVAGVLLAQVMLFFIGHSWNFAFAQSVYKYPNPIAEAVWRERFLQTHSWEEVFALIVSCFAGSLVACLISTRQNLLHALLVPPVLLLFYHSMLGPEVTMLALPLWMFIALLAWKLGETIKMRLKKKSST